MKIGNIVSLNKINVSNEFNLVKSIDEIILGVPTLIVGFETIKELYPDFNIINREIDGLTFWTFNRNEKKDLHDIDLDKFITLSYNNIRTKIKYFFIDPINYSLSYIKKILLFMDKYGCIISYKHNNMVYMLCGDILFGVDIKLMDFIGIKTNKLVDKIKNKSSVFLLNNEILIEYSGYVERLNNEVKYIPYLYSIFNG